LVEPTSAGAAAAERPRRDGFRAAPARLDHLAGANFISKIGDIIAPRFHVLWPHAAADTLKKTDFAIARHTIG
jgi:hypothetical protein